MLPGRMRMPLFLTDPATPWRVACARPGDMWVRQVFPGSAEHVSTARRLVAFLLADCPQVDDIALVTDELICNAIRHTRSGQLGGVYGLDGRRCDDVMVGVIDQGGTDQDPVPRTLHDSLVELAS